MCIPKEKQRTEIGYEVDFAVMPDSLMVEEWSIDSLDLQNEMEYADSFTYTLIYVDEDYIPELVVDRGSCAGR